MSLRPQIERIVEYTLRQHPCRIKLNQNENPFELPESIKSEILERVAAQRWSRYPSFVPEQQIAHLAAFTQWTPEGVLLGNGSNDLLQLIFTCTLDAERSIVLSQPTFTLYRMLAQSLGATVHEVPMSKTFAFDVDAIIETANRSCASLLVLCSPNNPTGSQLSLADLRKILDSTEVLVVLDEAYVHFASVSGAGLLSQYERLVILQTFSKAMGAAGLRFGYALLAPHLACQLNKVKLPYSVNIFTLTAAEVLMQRWNEVGGWIGTLVEERERLRSAMTSLDGIRVHRSEANFLLFETLRKPPSEVFEDLLSRGILIRDVSRYPMLERGLRVSVGTPQENEEFLGALKEVI